MLALALSLTVENAIAGVPLAMEPLSRVTVGASWMGGPSPIGLSSAFESRITRVLSAEFGGFLSPIPMSPGLELELTSEDDAFYLRHGLYGDLGFRIPHHQPKGFAWELQFRGGTGVVWSAHVSQDMLITDDTNYEITPSLAAMGGGDLLLRFGRFGFRVGGKAWAFGVVDQRELQTQFITRPQISLEALVQW